MLEKSIETQLAVIEAKLDSIHSVAERTELTNNDAHATLNAKQDILNGAVRKNQIELKVLVPLPKKVQENRDNINKIFGGLKTALVFITATGVLVGIITKILQVW